MAEIHYNSQLWRELKNPVEQKEYLKQIHSNVKYKVTSEEFYVQFTGTLAP